MRSKIDRRFGYLNAPLEGSEYLLDHFPWPAPTSSQSSTGPAFAKSAWPALATRDERIRARPHVARAMAEKLALFRTDQARAAA